MSKRILVVEDERIGETVVEVLEKEGFRVDRASNGKIGLEMAIAHEPDLILLDLRMPEMDGQTMLEALRAHQWGATAKVIILTAMDAANNMGPAYEAGISDYLVKSDISLTELLSRIKKALLEQPGI